jgi:hypothetical protein
MRSLHENFTLELIDYHWLNWLPNAWSSEFIQKMFRKHLLSGVLFSLRITDMWNSLPDYIVGAPSTNAFKSRLDKAMEKYMFRFEMPSTISNPVEV